MTVAGPPLRAPRSIESPPTVIAELTGQKNCFFRELPEALRQPMSGPTPVRKSSPRPSGTIHLL